MCYRHETELVQTAMAPSDARTIVRGICNEMHMDDVSDTAALLTSELVTNALQHARGPLHLDVACTRGQLIVSVSDGDPRPPRPRETDARSLGGRGLMLVAKLAEQWGSRPVPGDRKSVWFSLRPTAFPVAAGGCSCSAETIETADLDAPAREITLVPPPIPTSRNAT
jgi:anti-sigma regulatory factor (Ser/Thr protein kinase)